MVGRVLFRADSGPGIGDGHVMRCLALAQGFAAEGTSSTLLTEAPGTNAAVAWTSAGFDVLATRSPATDHAEVAGIRSAAASVGATAVMMDGYQFSSRIFDKLGATGLSVGRFDDTAEIDADCDLVINQNPRAEVRFAARYLRAGRALLGLDYACIREGVRMLRPAGGGGILICFGGSVHPQTGLTIARQVHAMRAAPQITLVAPGATGMLQDLPSLSMREPEDLVPLFQTADVVICGAGVTALEVLYLGIPAVVMPIADNQRPGAEALKSGHSAVVVESEAAAAEAALNLLTPGAGFKMPGAGIVDGQGSRRIHEALLEIARW